MLTISRKVEGCKPLVLGDANPDSEIIAGGDVVVWGSLRGDVTAGSDGDETAQVFALDMRPSSVTIAGVAAVSEAAGEDVHGDATGVAEVAAVDRTARQIVVTPATAAAARVAREEEEKRTRRTSGAAARKAAYITGRGLHSSTFQLNLSRF